jgi:hypothetical protein
MQDKAEGHHGQTSRARPAWVLDSKYIPPTIRRFWKETTVCLLGYADALRAYCMSHMHLLGMKIQVLFKAAERLFSRK